MSEKEQQEAQGAGTIAQGTYEILRDRLAEHASTLRNRAEALNVQRLEVFGGTEMAVLGTERIRTENNCVPRDIIQIGGHLLFGYNVFLGLKTETNVGDVFSLLDFLESEDGFEFTSVDPGLQANLLEDKEFLNDFNELYKYYKDTRLLQLRLVEGKALSVFQTGNQATDLKVFRWAVSPEGDVAYIDNRGERDHVFPASHDFEWTVTTREDYVLGRHPHVSILDEVFVETVGGDLTVKVEDNTEDGLGIYREDVEDANQALDDGEIHYAKLGSLILIKLLPFREEKWRHLVFNTRTQKVDRIDAIGQACVQLPEDHGIIFPGGFYLQSGETKSFEGDITDMEFVRAIRSPNGEDVLYVFHERTEGRKILLSYNMIRKEVANPIHCNGYSLFDDGKMVVYRSSANSEPTRVHPMQIWQTPYMSDEFAAKAPTTGSFLEKVGNADLVRGISDALSLCRTVQEAEPSVAIYEDLISSSVRTIDAYYWLGEENVGDLLAPIKEIRSTADLVVAEFEKVQSIKKQAAESLAEADRELQDLFVRIRNAALSSIDGFVESLAELRQQRGHLVSLREMRYMDVPRVDALEEKIIEQFDELSGRTVEFLSGDDALQPYRTQIAGLTEKSEEIVKTTEAEPLAAEFDEIGDGLELLTEILGTLKIDDPTVRTSILEDISEVLGTLNRGRAVLMSRRKEIASKEGVAEFGAQFALFTQSVSGALALADTPEKCDEQLSKLMLQLEDLEGRFGEFDQFLEQLATKREEVYEAFSSKKQSLLDARQRRAQRMMQAAERILDGIKRRASSFATADELNTYYVSDAMVAKVRDIGKELRELQESVKADELDSRLKSSKQDAARALRDRQEIFEGGADVIKFGRHRFSVNTQPFDLTLVPWKDGMAFHLSGTDFHEVVDDEEFETTRDFWNQLLVSETDAVYRSEYLAASMLFDAEEGKLDLAALETAAQEGGLEEHVRAYAAERYEEGYERGLHDHDAALILSAVLGMYRSADLLRFAPRPRAFAVTFWAFYQEQTSRAIWERRARSLGRLRAGFGHSPAIAELTEDLGEAIRTFFGEIDIEVHPGEAHLAGTYLFEELARQPVSFITAAEALRLKEAFVKKLQHDQTWRDFADDIDELKDNLAERFDLARAWMTAFIEASEDPEKNRPALEEAAVVLMTERHSLQGAVQRRPTDVQGSVVVEGLLGQHGRVEQRKMELRLDEFLTRLNAFRHDRVPGFRRYQHVRHEILERERKRLRLGEYMPKVMSAFVRNRLINEVYLPIIGDNLAKQMGSLGEGKRTDQMGLLLLVSPPGYGKTTLMEYIANRLGLVFVKVNGPALGHAVVSIDPNEAPNATARQEVEKINFALEMGNNVLLYLDDIQHTDSELLQKFISLCDAQRRIEGVWNGVTRTYDLRGKRFAICMAGNPYTEAGEKFQIPDMLANRADTYNLGDILEGKDDVFALSYLENSLTSNPVLAPLTTRDPKDVYNLIKMAQGEPIQADQLEHGYSAVEIEEILSVLRKMLAVQEVILQVNLQYIESAAQDDAFRTEPRFQLQGSYRNMNKMAEKIVAVMNDAELESLVDDHYQSESQTLTTGAEHNLLKLAELRDKMTPEQEARWEEIKRGYARRQVMGDAEDDPAVRMLGQMSVVSDRLQDIGRAVVQASAKDDAPAEPPLATALQPFVEQLHGNLTALGKLSAQVAQHAVAKSAPASGGGMNDAVAQALAAQASRVAEGMENVVGRLGELSQSMAARPAAAAPPAAPALPPPPAPGAPATPVPTQASPQPSLAPYLDKLGEAMARLADAPRGSEVVQTLDPSVFDVLERMYDTVGDDVMPLVKGLGRKIKGTALEQDRMLIEQMDRALKHLDQLKELVGALKKIDTRRLAG